MRIRATKPEFWHSDRISSVSWEDRLLFKGVEHYVDDNGVGKDDVALIVSDIFPRDMFANPRDTVAKVSAGLERLHAAGLLWRYTVSGDRLLYVAFWEQSQRIDRPGKGRLPRPDGTMNYGDSDIRESVASPRETFASGTGEQGNRGTGNPDTSSASPPPSQEPLIDVPEEHSTDLAVVDNVIDIRRDDAGAILGELIDKCTARKVTLTGRVRGHFAREIKTALDEKTEPDIIRAALSSMVADNVLDKPSWLPNRIVKAQTGAEVYRRGQSTSITDERAAGWIQLGAQMGAAS
jgi:hypothetical protein